MQQQVDLRYCKTHLLFIKNYVNQNSYGLGATLLGNINNELHN